MKKKALTDEQKTQNTLKKINQLLTQDPIKGATYYFITFLGTEDGQIQWHCYTRFEDFTETKPRREIRVPREIDPEKMRELVKEIKEPAFMINTEEDLAFFMHFGGHGIIEKSLADKAYPDITKPAQMVNLYPIGMENVESLKMENLEHFPTPKMRMRVFERDKKRCRICGRSRQDYEDLELQIHHIQPWADYGGITREDNLITLCKLCHVGLDPHFDTRLFDYVESSVERVNRVMSKNRIAFDEGVKNYRKIAQNIMLKKMKKIS